MRRGICDRLRTPCDMGHWGGQQKTDHMQRRTCSRHDLTGSNAAADTQGTTCKRQLATVQQTTDNVHRGKMQQTTRSVHQKTSRQHAPCSGQYANSKHALRNGQRATCPNTSSNMQRTTMTCNATDTMQQAAGNGQETTWKRHQTACNGQRTPRQPRTRQHAAFSRHRAKDGKHGQRMQQTTCIRQQTTCKRTRANARCNREHSTAAFRVRAAGNQQHARSIVVDNQCATRHRRHTQDATYDPCRSMQQTQMEPTTRSRQCNVMCEMTTGIRKLAHLGAASGFLRWAWGFRGFTEVRIPDACK